MSDELYHTWLGAPDPDCGAPRNGKTPATWDEVTCERCLEIRGSGHVATHPALVRLAALRAARVAERVRTMPHTCPRCGAAAYVGFMTVECSRGGCR